MFRANRLFVLKYLGLCIGCILLIYIVAILVVLSFCLVPVVLVLSFFIVPILCFLSLRLMVELFKRAIVMGIDCSKVSSDDGQSEERKNDKKKPQVVTKEPRSVPMSSNKIMSKNSPNMNCGDLKKQASVGKFSSKENTDLQGNSSKVKLSEGNKLEKSGKNTKPKRKAGKTASTKTDKTLINPPDETETNHDSVSKRKKRNINLQDQPEPKLDSANVKSGTEVQAVKRPKISPETQQSLLNENILLEFEKKLREYYQEQCKGKKPHQFWFDVCMQKDSGDVDKGFCTLIKLLPSTASMWKMLVYGLPRFGKTQLCQDLTTIWVSKSKGNAKDKNPNFKHFKFWILHELSEESVVDLEKTIVEKCYSFVSKITTADDFQNAWRSQIGSTLIILDGYDNLNQKQKLDVNSFIRGNEFFYGSSFLLTSRPNNDSDLGKLFNIQADICGLSDTTLTPWLGIEKVSDIQSSEIKWLYGVSPFFAQAVAKALSGEEKPQSLYDIVHRVMCIIFQSVVINDNEMNVLGQFLVRRLKYRKFTFEQSELPELLQEKCEVLKEVNIIVSCSPGHDGRVHLVVSHMVFMLYFCVKYLQVECDKLSSRDDRILLFKRYLSFEGRSEEYYTSSVEPYETYMLGLVPEIIFEVQSNRFEMVPDVENSKLSSAFKTQCLLLRADRTQLGIFGIAQVEETLMQDKFGDLLNLLDFNDLTIQQSYFTNTASSHGFVKLAAVGDEENENLATMLSVASSSNKAGQIQDIILEFKESEIMRLSSFLKNIVELFFGPCELDIDNSAPLLLTNIAVSALNSRCNCYTRLALSSNSLEPFSVVTWEIVSGSQDNLCSSFVHTVENQTVAQKYNFQQLKKNLNFAELIEKMKICVGSMQEVHITVDIKTNC